LKSASISSAFGVGSFTQGCSNIYYKVILSSGSAANIFSTRSLYSEEKLSPLALCLVCAFQKTSNLFFVIHLKYKSLPPAVWNGGDPKHIIKSIIPLAKISTYVPLYPFFRIISGAINPSVPQYVSKYPFPSLPIVGPANPKSAIFKFP
jgi:hypothetical protein